MTKREMLASVRPGDRVTILIPNGKGIKNGKIVQEWKEKTGTAMIVLSIVNPGTVALDMGGRFGTPGVATEKNIVKVKPAKRES